MIYPIALTKILGIPFVAWLGILTYSAFLLTASIGFTNYHHIKWLPFKWHPRMVLTSFTIATIHAFFALSMILGF